MLKHSKFKERAKKTNGDMNFKIKQFYELKYEIREDHEVFVYKNHVKILC